MTIEGIVVTKQDVINKCFSVEGIAGLRSKYPNVPGPVFDEVMAKFKDDLEEAKIFNFIPNLIDNRLSELNRG